MNIDNQIFELLPQISLSPLNKFSVLKQTKTRSIACLRFNDLLDTTQVCLIKQELKLPLCDLIFLESLSILSAYIFYIPVCNIEHNSFFLKLYLPSAENLNIFNNAKLIMQDSKITVFHSDDGACLISMNGLKRIIKPMMLRRSEKNLFEEGKEV